MTKLTKRQRQELKSLVIDASIRRLTSKETTVFISEQLGVSITETYVRQLRMQLKRDSAKELQTLQKDRDYYLQRMFWDRLAELEYQQKVLHGVIDRNHDNPDVTIKGVHELRGITTEMAQLFINLPAVSTMFIPIPFDSNIVQEQRLSEPIFGPDENTEPGEGEGQGEPQTYNKTF